MPGPAPATLSDLLIFSQYRNNVLFCNRAANARCIGLFESHSNHTIFSRYRPPGSFCIGNHAEDRDTRAHRAPSGCPPTSVPMRRGAFEHREFPLRHGQSCRHSSLSCFPSRRSGNSGYCSCCTWCDSTRRAALPVSPPLRTARASRSRLIRIRFQFAGCVP